jgi:hypothetical protein
VSENGRDVACPSHHACPQAAIAACCRAGRPVRREDRYSEAQPHEVLAPARRADVPVCPTAVGKRAPPLFAEIAALTGGRSFHPRDQEAIDRALTDVALERRRQSLLGYAPARQAAAAWEAGWRSIEVRVRGKGLRVRARDGYFLQ